MASNREPIKTTIQEIVDYWFARIDESQLSVDKAEAHERCWRSGCHRNLQRCHIIPDSLGGKDEPSNLVLLCRRCHADGPNVSDPQIMWDWIFSYKVPLYDTFWGILGQREYRFIYGKTMIEELKSLGIDTPEKVQQYSSILNENVYKKAGRHFGQPYLNTATIAGLYRMALKQIAEELGQTFPKKETGEQAVKSPWWMQME